MQLLEYDNRFKQYGNEFTFYDYNQPLELPSTMKHSFRIIIADPPYLVIFHLYHITICNLGIYTSQFFWWCLMWIVINRARSAWKRFLKRLDFLSNLENHSCFYSQVQTISWLFDCLFLLLTRWLLYHICVQVQCSMKEQVNSWGCDHVDLGHSIPASLGMNSDSSQTMILGWD